MQSSLSGPGCTVAGQRLKKVPSVFSGESPVGGSDLGAALKPIQVMPVPRCQGPRLTRSKGQNGSGGVVSFHMGCPLGWTNKVNDGLKGPAYGYLHVILFGEIAKKNGTGFLR